MCSAHGVKWMSRRLVAGDERIDARPKEREGGAAAADNHRPARRALAGNQCHRKAADAKHRDDNHEPRRHDDRDERKNDEADPRPVRALFPEALVGREERRKRQEMAAQVGVEFGKIDVERGQKRAEAPATDSGRSSRRGYARWDRSSRRRCRFADGCRRRRTRLTPDAPRCRGE